MTLGNPICKIVPSAPERDRFWFDYALVSSTDPRLDRECLNQIAWIPWVHSRNQKVVITVPMTISFRAWEENVLWFWFWIMFRSYLLLPILFLVLFFFLTFLFSFHSCNVSIPLRNGEREKGNPWIECHQCSPPTRRVTFFCTLSKKSGLIITHCLNFLLNVWLLQFFRSPEREEFIPMIVTSAFSFHSSPHRSLMIPSSCLSAPHRPCPV